MYTGNKAIDLKGHYLKLEQLNEEERYGVELSGYDFREMINNEKPLSRIGEYYESKRKDMESKVARSAVSPGVEDLSAAAGAAREYYILNHLTAKIIGKGVQSIEKLTSMQ